MNDRWNWDRDRSTDDRVSGNKELVGNWGEKTEEFENLLFFLFSNFPLKICTFESLKKWKIDIQDVPISIYLMIYFYLIHNTNPLLLCNSNPFTIE